MDEIIKVMVVFGTRPEAVKMCPLIKVLQKEPKIMCHVCLTGQHEEMLRSEEHTSELQSR